MRVKDISDWIENHDGRHNSLDARVNHLEATLRATVEGHEKNHHGVKSKALSSIPWTVIAILGSVVFQVVQQVAIR